MVKIARLAPPGLRPTMPAGASLLGDDTDGLVQRVQRLTQLAGMTDRSPDRSALAWRIASWAGAGAFLTAMIMLTANLHILATVHSMLERIVAALG
jgi:hypothetical protein